MAESTWCKLVISLQTPFGGFQCIVFVPVLLGIISTLQSYHDSDRLTFNCDPKPTDFIKQLCYDDYISAISQPGLTPRNIAAITIGVLCACWMAFTIYGVVTLRKIKRDQGRVQDEERQRRLLDHQRFQDHQNKFLSAYFIHVIFRIIFLGVMLGLFCSYQTIYLPSVFKCNVTQTFQTHMHSTMHLHNQTLQCNDLHYREKSNVNLVIIVVHALFIMFGVIEVLHLLGKKNNYLKKLLGNLESFEVQELLLDVPDQPTITNEEGEVDVEFTVTWSTPQTNGSKRNTEYRLEWRKELTAGSVEVHKMDNIEESSFKITGLKYNSKYEVKLFAVNTQGDSEPDIRTFKTRIEKMKPPTKSEEADITAQCSQSPNLADYPEQLVELIRRDYEGAVLCPFPWCEDELQFELSKIFTRLTIVAREKERKRVTDKLVKMTEVFKALKKCDCKCECECEGERPRVVLIEGPPGMGKTTYCQKLAYDWSVGNIRSESSFPKVDMLLRLTCRDMKTVNVEDAIGDQLLPINVEKKDKEKFFHFIHHNQTRILLVLDGLDELPKKLFEELLSLIKGRVFPQTYMYVMLTARHEAGMKFRRHCDALFEIVGYTKEDADNYICKYFSSHEKPILAGKLIEEIDRHSQLRGLTANALNTALLCLVFEDTDGILPYDRTMLYCELVNCVLRRYCSKKKISLDDKDPVEKYADQLNQLGELALEALLKDQLAFTLKELKSQSNEFLELGFLSRETSASKIKPKPTYAFIHKTFQEYFAALHLAHELLTTDKDKAAQLVQLTPVDKYWQVWRFLITMAASKCDDTAALWVSSIYAAFQHQKLDQFSNRPYAQQAKVSDDKWSKGDGNSPLLERSSQQSGLGDESYQKDDTEEKTTMPFYVNKSSQEEDSDSDSSRGGRSSFSGGNEVDICRDAKYNWVPLSRKFCQVNRKFSLVVKIVQAIAECEHPNSGLKPYQIKMADTLARCFPMDKITVKSSYDGITLHSRFPFVFSEFLNGSCKLNKLTWEPGVSTAAALANVLQKSHTLTHLDLVDGLCITSLTPALQANHTVTHLNMRGAGVGDVEAKALGTVLRSNHTLTHLCLDDNNISPIGVEALAEALKFNKVLEDLNIGGNGIGDRGAEALSQALKSNQTLRCLNVCGRRQHDHNGGDRGLSALAHALRSNSSLTYLDIHGHGFTDSSLTELGKALQSNCSLTHLYVGHRFFSFPPRSPFGDSSAKAFSKALQSCDTRLTRLDLGRMSISSAFVITLAEGLRVNGTLERLDLSRNHIGCRGAEALALALKNNRTLTHLQLKRNKIGDDGAEKFVEVLRCNKILMFLGLLQNRMTEPGGKRFGVLNGHLQWSQQASHCAGIRWKRTKVLIFT